MYWINIKGKFATDNPDLFIQNLQILLHQTKTIFTGEITQQKIQDIPCELISKNTVEETINEENSK